MENRKFYKTSITIQILSEGEPVPDGMELDDLSYEMRDGNYVGVVGEPVVEELTSKQMADELYFFGSVPSFFLLDENGNPLGEDEE